MARSSQEETYLEKEYELVADRSTLRLKREATAVGIGTVDVHAVVDLDTGKLRLEVDEQGLRKLRQDADHSAR